MFRGLHARMKTFVKDHLDYAYGWLLYAPPRTTTPPSGVSARFDSGRTCLNCGANHFLQAYEKA
jgi:hypothetical protein